MRDRKAGFGPALSDQDSRARKFEELRCRIPRNLEAELGKGGGDWTPTGGSCGVSYLLPSSSSQFTSSCFQAMKFFPGKIRARPPHPGCVTRMGGAVFKRTEAGGPGEGAPGGICHPSPWTVSHGCRALGQEQVLGSSLRAGECGLLSSVSTAPSRPATRTLSPGSAHPGAQRSVLTTSRARLRRSSQNTWGAAGPCLPRAQRCHLVPPPGPSPLTHRARHRRPPARSVLFP